MLKKSAKRSKVKRSAFAPAILSRAREIAGRYQVILQFEDGEYFGRGLEMPLVMADGKTPDACVAATREALAAVVATIMESGKTPPAPAMDQTRSVQINIRLTAAEKELLEQSAHRHGFRGLSDYARHALLTTSE
jgi:predicted RNase H-like HicB family nuclease